MKGLNRFSGEKQSMFSVLDIGSSKVSCIIGRYEPHVEAEDFVNRVPDLSVIGFGVRAAKGMKSGVVIDLEAAEDAIRACVSEAERSAGLTIDEVAIPISCGRLTSVNFAASDHVRGGKVDIKDVTRVIDAGSKFASRPDRSILHLFPIGFRLDENSGVRDPIGMVGSELATDIHAVTAEHTPISNLMLAIEKSELTVSNVIASPYASAISTIVPDEAKLGVTCIDIGGGTTKFAVFAEGHFIYCDSFPVGGHHITLDIARALGTSPEEAERIKTLHGSLVYAQSDDEEVIYVSRVSDPGAHENCLTKAQLSMLIRPRVEEILAAIQERLDKSGFSVFAGERVVLTGGTADLSGIDQFAAHFLGKPVRIGPPLPVGGLPEIADGPSFASSVGALLFDLYPQPLFGRDFRDQEVEERSGYITQVTKWIKESF